MVSGSWFRISGSKVRLTGSGAVCSRMRIWVSDFGIRDQGVGFRVIVYGLGIRILGLRIRVSGSGLGYRIWGLRFRVPGSSGFRVPGSVFQVSGTWIDRIHARSWPISYATSLWYTWFNIQGSGFRVEGSGEGVGVESVGVGGWGLGFRFQDLRFRVQSPIQGSTRRPQEPYLGLTQKNGGSFFRSLGPRTRVLYYTHSSVWNPAGSATLTGKVESVFWVHCRTNMAHIRQRRPWPWLSG